MGKVKIAPTAGFCFGVERAVKLATSALEDSHGLVYTLGPIIHNPQEVERLESRGLMMANTMEDIESGTVIIRSHGAPKGILEEAQARGLEVVDATCPFVNRLKERVVSLASEGYQVIIVGQADHPEVKALLSFVPENSLVTMSIKDLKKRDDLKTRVGIVAQTTHSLENLQRVASYCVGVCREVKVYSTTCQATNERRRDARAMAKEVDVMIVVGGRNSANTTRLSEAARQEGAVTHHIENASEIAELSISPDSIVGITAGASTPAWVIDEIIEALESILSC